MILADLCDISVAFICNPTPTSKRTQFLYLTVPSNWILCKILCKLAIDKLGRKWINFISSLVELTIFYYVFYPQILKIPKLDHNLALCNLLPTLLVHYSIYRTHKMINLSMVLGKDSTENHDANKLVSLISFIIIIVHDGYTKLWYYKR